MANWRTEIHAELNRRLRDVVGEKTAKAFAALGIETVGDLVRHVPRRYIAGTEMSSFSGLRVGDDVAVVAKVRSCQIRQGRQARVEVQLTDGMEVIRATFFAAKSYLADYWSRALSPGARGIFIGKVGEFRGELQLAHPDFVMLDERGQITARKSQTKQAMQRAVQRATLVGLYPASAKLPTWNIAEAIDLVLPQVTGLGDPLPEWVVERADVPSFATALKEVHQPVSRTEAERGIARLRFDEALGLQLAMAERRRELAELPATPRIRVPDRLLTSFDERLPFELTTGQQAVGEALFAELESETAMHRLLQGDVGSGKTLVALRAMLAVVDAGGQAALLAPTEVLAMQHYQTISRLLGDLGTGGQLDSDPNATQIALLTGSLSTAARKDALQRLADGSAGIIVGTHALLSDPVTFADLGFIVVDEQHRFGVEQRAALAAKSEKQPHMLVMTATPIPRSLAMTVFGDLAVSELTEKPAGRAEVKTVYVNTQSNPSWVDRAWERITEEVAAGHQAFIVAPAITTKSGSGPELTAVTELYTELSEGPLRDLKLGIVHGKQPSAEREQQMADFVAGKTDVLIATTVIEVGVDVPNATVMVVMNADRFGISQLHQLRGRIGRGNLPGLCLLLADPGPDNQIAEQRLQALVDSNDGFELAETDLALRREGDVLGAAQSGASSLKLVRVLTDAKLLARTRELAEDIVADPRFATDPHLRDLRTEADLIAAADWLEMS